jgi:hypothetical protein
MKMKFVSFWSILVLALACNLLYAGPTLAAGPTSTTSVAGVTDVTTAVNAQGVFNQDVNASSDDNNVVLHILAATTGLNSNGTPLTQVSIIHLTTAPPFQTGAGMISLAYDFQPSGATFNQSATATFGYEPTLIPAGVAATSLQISYFDNTENSWIAVPATVDTTSHTISAQITHFTAYAITYGVTPVTQTTTTSTTTTIPTTEATTTTTTPAIPTTPVVTSLAATFKADSLIINPGTVKPGENVNIYLTITNTGDITGTDTVELKINGIAVDSNDITIDGGLSKVVTFNASRSMSGNYLVEVAGLNGNFSVSKSITPLWFWLTGVAAFLLGMALAVIFIILRNKKS